MPTPNPRVNITLDKSELFILSAFAKKKKSSLSSAAKQLILKALELEEDIYLSELAEKRLEQTKKWVSHKDAWK